MWTIDVAMVDAVLISSIQGRSQNLPVGGDDEMLADRHSSMTRSMFCEIEFKMLRSDVSSVARKTFGVGISGILHLIMSYFHTV